MQALLAIATLLGGATAIWFLWDKWQQRTQKAEEIRLVVDYRAEPPFEATEPTAASGHAVRYQRIEVRNPSAQNLSGCIVKLEEMKRADGANFNNAFLPVGLMTQHQRMQGRVGGAFNLRAGERKLVEVACLDEADPRSEIRLLYETNRYPNPVPRADYVLKLGVYGGPHAVEEFFRLYVSNDGYLRLRRYDMRDPNKLPQATREDARA